MIIEKKNKNNLDISGTTCIRQSLTLNNNGLNNSNIISFNNASNNYITQQIDSGGNFLKIGRNTFNDLCINSSGFVGINNSNPTNQLDAIGNRHITGTLNAGSNIATTGQISSSTLKCNGAVYSNVVYIYKAATYAWDTSLADTYFCTI